MDSLPPLTALKDAESATPAADDTASGRGQAVSPESKPAAPVKAAPAGNFPDVAAQATQAGPNGIRFDFNEGCRISVPDDQDYTVQFRDLDTGNILYRNVIRSATIVSTRLQTQLNS